MRGVIVAILAGFILAGCFQKTTLTTKPKQIEVSQEQIEAKIESFYNECSKLNNPSKCKRFVDEIYQSGDFKSAAIAYDMICYGFQYIPACKQLADMFVYGDGVTKDIDTAITIYQIACNNGENESCDLARNLRSQKSKK